MNEVPIGVSWFPALATKKVAKRGHGAIVARRSFPSAGLSCMRVVLLSDGRLLWKFIVLTR